MDELGPSPEENSADPLPQAPPRLQGFFSVKPLPDVSQLAGKDLAPERRAELQAYIDEVNAGIAAIEREKIDVAEDWADLRIDMGNYSLAASDESEEIPKGTIAIRSYRRIGGSFALASVVIPSGECADLDVLQQDAIELRELALANIERYLAGGRLEHLQGHR